MFVLTMFYSCIYAFQTMNSIKTPTVTSIFGGLLVNKTKAWVMVATSPKRIDHADAATQSWTLLSSAWGFSEWDHSPCFCVASTQGNNFWEAHVRPLQWMQGGSARTWKNGSVNSLCCINVEKYLSLKSCQTSCEEVGIQGEMLFHPWTHDTQLMCMVMCSIHNRREYVSASPILQTG